jgi:hypothetical protein
LNKGSTNVEYLTARIARDCLALLAEKVKPLRDQGLPTSSLRCMIGKITKEATT